MADNDTGTLWQAVDEIRNRQSQIEARVAAHDARLVAFLEEFRESRRERKEQIEAIAREMRRSVDEFNTKLDELRLQVSEAHGMAKFGRWLAGVALVVIGWFISKGVAS